MKSGLQRIEATLNQLDTLPDAAAGPRADQSGAQATASPKARSVEAQSVAPATQPAAPVLLELPFGGKPLPASPSAPETSQTAPSNPAPGGATPISPSLAQAVSLKAASAKAESAAPDLPGFPFTPLVATRHATDPALALGILREIEGTLLSWQRELQRLQLEIQELHMEGPIIDGWLESQPTTPPPPEAEFIRHAEIDALMGYVQTLCDTAPDGMIQAAPRAGYRLCGLDADGKVWSRECPPERVPQVSLAIARCQKVRQLLTRKNDLESRLSKLAEHLVSVHSELMT